LPEGLAALQSAWENGNNTARDIVGQAADAVSAAISNLAKRFHPDVICIGGGVTTHLPALLREVSSRYAPPNDPRDDHPSPRVEPARLGDQAGVIGAALLALRTHRLE
jgi:glucokinase